MVSFFSPKEEACLSDRSAYSSSHWRHWVPRRPSSLTLNRGTDERLGFEGIGRGVDFVAIKAIMANMATEKASVAHAKNTLSSLINKVAYGKTRVVLESRGKPKAALISTEDLEKLERLENRAAAPQRPLNILLRAQALRGKMRRRRKKLLPDSAELLDQLRAQRDRGI